MPINKRAFILAVACSLAGPVWAQSGETPPMIEGAKTVTSEEVKPLIGKATFLDVRKKASFLEGKVPGAKSIAEFQDPATKAFNPVAYGDNKAAVIVIYGHGSDGWSSVAAVKGAVATGYANVLWLREGWTGWTAKKMPTE